MVSAGRKPGSPRRTNVPRGELALIDRIRARAALLGGGRDVRAGIGDDCAILRPRAGEEMVVTTDFSLEGRHFRRDWHTAASVGHRTLARGLSDIAAMGARPVAAFLSLALPRAVAKDTRWLEGFLDGMLTLAAEFGVTLAGGDTSEAPGEHILADIMLIGAAPAGKALRRSGARAGDLLYVTGSLGGAAAELAALGAAPKRFARAVAGDVHPHLFPQPRIAVGKELLRRGLATACMDLSDGISTDLAHLCAASGVGAIVDFGALPVNSQAAALENGSLRHAVLHGGEDYELLFTARPATKIPRTIAGVVLTQIGRMADTESGRSVLLEERGAVSPLGPGGWEHFSTR